MTMSREDFDLVSEFKLQNMNTIHCFMPLPGINATPEDWETAGLTGALRWKDAGKPKLK